MADAAYKSSAGTGKSSEPLQQLMNLNRGMTMRKIEQAEKLDSFDVAEAEEQQGERRVIQGRRAVRFSNDGCWIATTRRSNGVAGIDHRRTRDDRAKVGRHRPRSETEVAAHARAKALMSMR